MEIKDFGEKIGGAKKDLWKARGLRIEDILEMNDAEKTAFIKKDNVWQKPDYQSLVDSGIPVRVVYFMKKMRDATPTKPILTYSDNTPEKIAYKQEGYISFVSDLHDAVMGLRTEQDVLEFYENYLAKKYITREPGKYYVTVSDLAFGCIDNKLLRAAQVNNFSSIDRDIKKKQFCYSEQSKQEAHEQAFKKNFDIFPYVKDKVTFDKDYAGRTRVEVNLGYGRMYFYPQGAEADVSSWQEGKYFVLRDARVLAKNLNSREEAQDYVDKLYKAFLDKNEKQADNNIPRRKTRFLPKQLAHIKRDGENYRQGVPATGEKYMEVFGFKGGEFGNWMSENDRRASLDYGYDALIDMCKALNISTKDVSLGGRLSIAFGARGSAGAAAHYEPLREVINLTKMHGAGSLAHEWAHALDDILGKELGFSSRSSVTNAFMTENTHKPTVPQSLKALVDSMRYKTVLDEDIVARQKADVEDYTKRLKGAVENLFPKHSMSDSQLKKLQILCDAYIQNAKGCLDSYATCVWTGDGNKDIDALSAFKKELTGHGMPKQERIDFAHYQNNLRDRLEKVGTEKRVRTDFYENSIRFDKRHSKTDHGYWQSTVEMFARAFACYVRDKVEGNSDYLVGHSESAVAWVANPRTDELELIKAIPEGDERATLNRCFDELIVELKDKGLLHDYEPVYIHQRERKPSLLEQIRGAEDKRPPSVKETNSGQLAFEF